LLCIAAAVMNRERSRTCRILVDKNLGKLTLGTQKIGAKVECGSAECDKWRVAAG